jgi:thymidylate synthase (FAD)
LKVELLAVTPDAELLIERAGRTCYLSTDKINEESHKRFIRMIIKNRHHSVLEHASATFRITGGSRSFTHQMVRHRLCSFSQQSQRYVDEHGFSIVTPPAIAENKEAKKIFDELVEHSKKAYEELQSVGLRKEDARFVLPNAVESELVLSANFRELRHVFNERCARDAQWEIRAIAIEMLKIMQEVAPTVFEDFVIDESGKFAKTPF